MREIRFRAWHEGNKEIINWETLCKDGFGVYSQNFFMRDDIILMQFTGLKNKNGKEIYEGDIVRVNIPDPINKVFYENFIIVWQQDKMRFGLQELNKKDYPYSWAFTPKNDFEVIGNIYENPELLKGL